MRKTIQCGVMLVAMICFAGSANAESRGDPKAGAEKSALCQGCHGGDGNSEDATFPRLAGQYAAYIAKQVQNFQQGIRTNSETMAGMAATVTSDEDLWDIAAYFSSQKMVQKPLVPVDVALAAKGETIYLKGVPDKDGRSWPCFRCHGERGKGKSPDNSVFPVIGGQHRDYLVKQLKEFRDGARNNDPAGMMRAIAASLTDEEIDAVANYLSSLL